MKIAEILERAGTVVDALPDRKISENTRAQYRKVFTRMWRAPIFDAMAPGIAIDTYYHRRAAFHWTARWWLRRLSHECLQAARRNDIASVQRWAGILIRVLGRIEAPLEVDPPLKAGTSPLQSPASRWQAQDGPHPRRGANSKKNVLALLPRDWDKCLWRAALEVWSGPADVQDLDALAVQMVAPVRPEELVPGQRAHGRSEGILITRQSARRIGITIYPAKSHDGRFGTEITTINIDPIVAGGPSAYLAQRCAASGGQMVISIASKNAARKKIARLGRLALPDCDTTITPYVVRHQVIADFKATLGSGVAVAGAAGQCTDRTQAKYGRVEHGRKRSGLIGVECKRVPRGGNVERARELSAKRGTAPRPQ